MWKLLIAIVFIGACLALGIGLGVFLGRQTSGSDNSKPTVVVVAPNSSIFYIMEQEAQNPSGISMSVVQLHGSNKDEARSQAQELKDIFDTDNQGKLMNLFSVYVSDYRKTYPTEEEAQTAFAAFISNLRQIMETNLDYSKKFVVGLNKYSDLDDNEFRSSVLMQVDPLKDDTHGNQGSGNGNGNSGQGSGKDKEPKPGQAQRPGTGRFLYATDEDDAMVMSLPGISDSLFGKRRLSQVDDGLPQAVDHRTSGVTTRVRDQGRCGSCWAFAGTSAIESAVLLSSAQISNGSLALSHQQLLDCTVPENGFTSLACRGGSVQEAIDFVYRYGQVQAELRPYQMRRQSCPASMLVDIPTPDGGSGVLLSYLARRVTPQRVDALLEAVARQPVSVYFMMDESFVKYKSGIYHPSTCTDAVNHALMVVGFDRSDSDESYWIVQNSLGTSWGEQGFGRIVMLPDGKGPCGMYRAAYYPEPAFDVLPRAWTSAAKKPPPSPASMPYPPPQNPGKAKSPPPSPAPPAHPLTPPQPPAIPSLPPAPPAYPSYPQLPSIPSPPPVYGNGAPPPREDNVTVIGRLIAASEGGTYRLQLSDKSGGVVRLPSRPILSSGGGLAEIGAQLEVTCDFMTTISTKIYNCEGMSKVVYLASALKPPLHVEATGEITTSFSIKMLVTVVQTSCSDIIQNLSLSAVRTNFEKAADHFSLCSYGSMTMSKNDINVMYVTVDNCALYTNCDVDYIAQLAYEQVKIALGGNPQSFYTHWGIVLPYFMGSQRNGCYWDPGLANVGTYWDSWAGRPTTTWYSPVGAQKTGVIMQEILHNFGLWHGSQDATVDGLCDCHSPGAVTPCYEDRGCHNEYGDNTTCMGSGNVCPSAVELYRLNWVSTIDVLTESNFQPGTTFSYVLPPVFSTPKNTLVVKPSWAGDKYNFNLYFSTKARGGGDLSLESKYLNTLLVHSINKMIDPLESNENGDIHLLGYLPIGTKVYQDLKLVVNVISIATNKDMYMSLCRFISSATECTAGQNVPSPSPPKPSSPSPPRPPPPSPSPRPPPPSPSPPKTDPGEEPFFNSGLVYSTPGFLPPAASKQLLQGPKLGYASDVIILDSGCFLGGSWIWSSAPGYSCQWFRGTAEAGLPESDTATYWVAAAVMSKYIYMLSVRIIVQANGDVFMHCDRFRKCPFTGEMTQESVMERWASTTTNMRIATGFRAKGVNVANAVYTMEHVFTKPDFLKNNLANSIRLEGPRVDEAGQVSLLDESCYLSGTLYKSSIPGLRCRMFRGTADGGFQYSPSRMTWIAAARYTTTVRMVGLNVEVHHGDVFVLSTEYRYATYQGTHGIQDLEEWEVNSYWPSGTKGPLAQEYKGQGMGIASLTYLKTPASCAA